MTVPTHRNKSSPGPKTLPLPLSLPDASPPQALPTFCNAYRSFQPRLGNGYAPHRGLRCTFRAKGQGRKPERKKWEQETSELVMGEGAYGKHSYSDSGLVLTPHPFPPTPKPQPLCERKLGLWFLFCLGTRSGSEEGAGKSSGSSFQGH